MHTLVVSHDRRPQKADTGSPSSAAALTGVVKAGSVLAFLAAGFSSSDDSYLRGEIMCKEDAFLIF